jgi:hypothetical protein
LQQYESAAHTAVVQESHDDVSGVVCVEHSPHVGPLAQTGAGLAVGEGQSLYLNPPAVVYLTMSCTHAFVHAVVQQLAMSSQTSGTQYPSAPDAVVHPAPALPP